MSEWVNPYIAGAPVTEAKMFFGRADIFDWIERSLTGRYADHILVVHGQRRVGKTSVLKQLHNRLPERYVPVFFDFQGRTHTTLDRFLWWLSREIVRVLKQDRGISVPMPEKDAFTNDPDYLDNQFLPNLQPALGDRTLLLTFDEFDNLEEAEVKQALARPLVDYLRRLMGNPGLNFIFSIGSSGRKLENMQASYTEFFKTALYKKISFLDKENCFDLITRPVEGVLEYDRDAVNRIYAITSGHPYFTQLLCHELFSQCQKTEQRQVREADVAGVLDDVIERGTVNLKFVWDEASDLEKWILAGLAQIEGKRDPRTLADFLRRQRVRFSEPDLNAALLHLREKDVLANDNRFVIYLMHLWLQENRPIEQVREELTEVNPIANRYIEIGLEFKDNHQYDKAIESFQQALSVDSDNIQAQVSIAATYLDQKLYDKAVVEFERALTIDEEDVAARAGLCEAHLALGDQALSKGRTKEAAQSYQRVLAINTEHTEARQRMAEIQRQRAEKALADGRDEEALSAFEDALKFTPEDPALGARLAQVRVEKRAKISAGLLARAEREQAAKNYDRALAALDDALKLSPEDASIQTKIALVRAEQRAAQLAAILTRADQAVTAERWDDALAALDESLALQPDDAEIRTKRTDVLRQKRAAQLYGHKARARGMAKFERWNDALAAWRAYLAMEPEDRAAAEAEIAQVERQHEMARAYGDAQNAIARKNYDRAIQLLKAVVVEDAAYKNASQLMAQAIELRRTAKPFWQSKRLLGGIGAAVVVIVTMFGFALFQSSPPLMVAVTGQTTTPTISPTPTETAPPTLTPTVTPTFTPSPTCTPTLIPTAIPLVWSRISSGLFLLHDTVTTLVVDPSDPGVLYAGTANAGTYKSLNGGVSWQPAHNGLGRATIHTLIVDPREPRTLYAGALSGGVYKTTDGGQNWKVLSTGFDLRVSEFASIVAMDAQDNRHLYYSQGFSLYESFDAGASWNTIAKSGCPDAIANLVVHPADSKTLLARSVGMQCTNGVYTSRDGGRTWAITNAQFGGGLPYSLAMDSQKGNVIFAASNDALYRSADGGTTWNHVGQGGCTALAVARDNSAVAYCANAQGIAKTRDGGQTWQTLGKVEPFAASLYISPHSGNTLLAGGAGLSISTDGGATWLARSSGLGGIRFQLKLDSADGSLYAEDDACRIYRSTDRGRNWQVVQTSGGCNLGFDAGGQFLYLSSANALLRSRDKGATWESLAAATKRGDALAAHPRKSGVLLLPDAPADIYLSTNSGTNWQKTSGVKSIVDARLVFDSAQAQVVYAIGSAGQAARSSNDGQTWEQCPDGKWLTTAKARAVVDPRDNNRLILATRGDGVLVSADGCKSWQAINVGLGNWFVNAIAMDPKKPDELYVGTDSGAYVSSDGGKNWGAVNNGLLNAFVIYSIVVDPRDSSVYAATPYGIFKLEAR